MIDRGIDRCEKWAVRFVVLVAQLVMRRVAVNVAKVPDARFSGFTLVIPFLALVAIPLLVTDLVTLNIWVFDYSLPLDTSLRWVYGHVPHIDYPTPIGISYWLLQGFATDLIGIDARTPIIANFLRVPRNRTISARYQVKAGLPCSAFTARPSLSLTAVGDRTILKSSMMSEESMILTDV